MGMVVLFSNSMSFFAGACLVALLRRHRRERYEPFVLPVSSGLIAGESLLGILLAALVALGWMAA